jgi:5-methylcytosine-specific restriction endonuclease McrA
MRDWYLKNREVDLEKKRSRYRAKHPKKPEMSSEEKQNRLEARRERTRLYQQKWRAKNPDRHREILAKYKKSNPEVYRAGYQNRRARKLSAPGSYKASDVAEIKRQQKLKCACCKVSIKLKWHVDHIVPLSRGGTNFRRNLQLLCAPCNQAKYSKLPEIFMRERGYLI